MRPILILLVSVLLTVIGQIFWKIGANQVGQITISISNFIPSTIKLFTNIWVIFGCAVFIVSSILWVAALTKLDLSFAFPFLSLGYVLIFLVSYLIFHEQISTLRLAGMILICIGVIFVAKS